MSAIATGNRTLPDKPDILRVPDVGIDPVVASPPLRLVEHFPGRGNGNKPAADEGKLSR
jgi:hypothetical protein